MKKPFKLYVRYCACGCGSSWKALKSSTSKYWSRSHDNSQTYQPWRTERSKFRAVRKWLTAKFGEVEKESDLEILEQIDREEIKL